MLSVMVCMVAMGDDRALLMGRVRPGLATLMTMSIMGGRYFAVCLVCGLVQPHLRILTDISVRS